MSHDRTTNQSANQDTKPPAFIAWYVAERAEKSFWTRIGAAWDHRDGEGLTLQLDLVPAQGGRIVLRSPKEGEEAEQPQS